MEISANLNAANVKQNKENTQLAVRAPFGSMALSVRNNTTNPTGANQPKLQAEIKQDTFQPNKDKFGTLMKSIPLLYMAGFALGFCPGLFLVASAAFLFSGKGESFRNELSNALMSNNSAINQLQMQFNKACEQNSQKAEEVKPAENNENKTVEAKVSNPVEQEKAEKEEKVLTPLDIAQMKYAKAKEYQEKMSLQVQKREESARVAQEKLEVAQARLDRAQEQYDKAKAEIKAQMTDKMIKMQENVNKKEANARVANERADLAKAQLAEATAKLAQAQRVFEDLQAEEMVEI